MNSMNIIFIRWNMTSSSHLNILMMGGVIISSVGLSHMFLGTISCISLRLTLNICRLLIRMMNSLSSYYFSLRISCWLTFFVFSNRLYIMIRLMRYIRGSLNMWLTLTLIMRCLNIRLRHSLNMILTIAFIYYFNSWIGFFIFFPRIINCCLYIFIITIMWSALNICFCMWLSMYISFSVFSIRSTLNITLSISMSCWLILYISCSRFIMICLRSVTYISCYWCCINISSCWIGMNCMFLMMNRSFSLFKGLHIRIIIIMFYMMRSTINISILMTKVIIILFNMNRSGINFNMCRLVYNFRGSINMYLISTMITMSNHIFNIIPKSGVMTIFLTEIIQMEIKFIIFPLSVWSIYILDRILGTEGKCSKTKSM